MGQNKVLENTPVDAAFVCFTARSKNISHRERH